jgi:hypothetical protein
MRKIIITYGLIAGAIVSAMMLISQPLLKNGTINFDNGMIIGYASMVIAFTMIFVAIKNYRDHYQKGTISFWQAFKIGLLITLITSLMYAVTWEIYYNTAAPDFMERYTEHYLQKIKDEGGSQAEFELARTEMETLNSYYKILPIRFAMTLMEILPVGLIISLLSALLLRKRELLPI